MSQDQNTQYEEVSTQPKALTAVYLPPSIYERLRAEQYLRHQAGEDVYLQGHILGAAIHEWLADPKEPDTKQIWALNSERNKKRLTVSIPDSEHHALIVASAKRKSEFQKTYTITDLVVTALLSWFEKHGVARKDQETGKWSHIARVEESVGLQEEHISAGAEPIVDVKHVARGLSSKDFKPGVYPR